MSKQKIVFSCSGCAYKSIKWLGCCPECKEWDSFQEITTRVGPISHATVPSSHVHSVSLVGLADIPLESQQRMVSGLYEWDRVMGGGIMPGSFIILTGDSGIGKSTLVLQMCNSLADTYRIFYFSTEESLAQVKIRAQRLGCIKNNLLFSDQPHLETITHVIRQEKPDIVVIDSVQNCFLSESQTTPGSIAQLRESAFQLMRLAKEYNIAILITGHITKEGTIAGPKTLEHMVDAVFYLQGEDRWQIRVLRAVKNRFGTINELGFFEMQTDGLREITNINAQLVNDIAHAAGSVLISYLEGSRPLLLELQALAIASRLTLPQRVISGIDHTQVVLIAAILEKYLRVKLSTYDIFFKVTSGFKLRGSGLDLGIAIALLSSYFQKPLPVQSLALGEISLSGHIKPVNHMSTFLREAAQYGITSVLIAENQKLETSLFTIHRFSHIYDLMQLFAHEETR